MIELDRKLFLWINGWENRVFDYLLTWPTYLGNFQILLLLALAGMFLFDRKNWIKRYIFFSVSLLAAYFLMEFLKLIFSRPQPFDSLNHNVMLQAFFEKPESFSFPSGHAMLAFAAAVLINALYPHRKFLLLYFLAFWISLTRVYLGFHYPSDILAGAIFGIVCALIAALIYRKALRSHNIN